MSNTGSPSFPTSSLYSGSFPSFPTFNFSVTIPTSITIDGIPIPVPPPLAGYALFSVKLPDIFQIPQWALSVITYGILWIFGWLGAIAEYIAKAFDYYTITPFTRAINYLLGIFDNVLNIFENISRFAGPLQIDVASALMGILLLVIIVGSYLIIKGISALIAGGE